MTSQISNVCTNNKKPLHMRKIKQKKDDVTRKEHVMNVLNVPHLPQLLNSYVKLFLFDISYT